MRKLLFTMTAAVALLFTACDKDKDQEQTPASAEFEFKIDQTDFNFKSDVPECLDLDLDYVKFVVNGVTYTSDIYYVEGEMLTEVIKLPVGEYTMTSFLVYNDNGTTGDESDDILVKASPSSDSEYFDLMTNPLDLTFSVDAFFKKQITVDVLCFEDLFYESFGFTWFQFNDIKIERLAFFGDICTGCYIDYEGSLYDSQLNGVQMDMPAIFQVKIFKEGVTDPIRTFDNSEWFGEGAALEVYWPNDLSKEDNFTFELWVLLPSGDSFDYQLITVWDVQDEFGPEGDDGIVDFVLGSCQIQGADYQFAYHMDLPTETFTMTTGNPSPGVNGTYFDITLTGIGSGFLLGNESYGIYCADKNHTINLGTTYTGVSAYNSLSSTLPGNFPMSADEIVFVNYFFNHIPDYIPGWSYDNPSDAMLVQNVIWGITDAGSITLTGEALTILNSVMANGADYNVPPGGYAGIIFWGDDTDPQVQLIFTLVDPCEN